MNSAVQVNSNGAFETSIKENPRLNYHKFRREVISYVSSQCCEITGQTGCLGFVLTPAQWAAIPGHSVINAAGNLVVTPIFDIVTLIPVPLGNAPAATVKLYEIARNDRLAVIKAIQVIKTRFIHSAPTSDLSQMGDEDYGMMHVDSAAIFAHFEGTHSVLNSNDVALIFVLLKETKNPTHDYATLAEIHRDAHALLNRAGQPMNEYTKTVHFTEALRDDPQGREAAAIFVREHPLMMTRTFIDLVATVILHAPTIVITTASLGYANAAIVNAPAASAFAAPTDEVGMALLIANTQKNLAALRKKNGTSTAPAPRAPAGPLQYCYKHGYTSTHSGSVCKFMKDNPALFQATHLAAKDPLAVAGGNPRIGK